MNVMQKPLVSIIMPVYNMGEHLRKSVPSVLNQTYQNIELILVDDGSKDNSLEVCRELAVKDNRIKVFHQDNQGSGPARNPGITNAAGQYAYFPDADDCMVPNAIESLIEKFEKYSCDMIVFGYKMIFSDGTERKFNDYPNEVFTGSYVRQNYDIFTGDKRRWEVQGAPWNKIFSLDIIKSNNVEFPALRRNQDEVFVMRYVNSAEKIALIDEIFYIHYPNDMRLAFNKFPIDYFEIVSSLNGFRMEYIYSWNPENRQVLNDICSGFIQSTTKSMMLLFNPKWELSFKERYKRFKEISVRCVKEMPDKDYKSDSTMFKLMKSKHYFLLYIVVYFALRKNKKYIR